MQHKGTNELVTKRLILRQFKADDAQMMFDNWACDSEVTKYLRWPAHDSVEITKMILNDWLSHYDEQDFYQWAITLKENDEPIGSIAVVEKNDDIKMVHIGYCLGQKWWRQGITSEALNALIKYFFEEVGVNRIESLHDPKNPNSGKVMKKCNMQYEGTMRDADWSMNGICSASMYAILLSDYRSLKK